MLSTSVSESVVSSKPDGGDDVAESYRLTDGSIVALLADGATGVGEGRQAANIFIELCKEQIYPGCNPEVVLPRVCFAADLKIMEQGLDADTTGLILVLKDEKYTLCSVGDSEAWMKVPGGLIELSSSQQSKPRIGSFIKPPVVVSGHITGPIIVASDGLRHRLGMPSVWFTQLTKGLTTATALTNFVFDTWKGNLPDDVAVILIEY